MTSDGGTEKDFINKGLGELFFECLTKYASRPIQFIVDKNQIDTCKELLKRSVRTAIKLRDKNIKPGDIIGLCTSNHINACVPLIAAQFLGAICSNFDLNISMKVAIDLLQLVQPKIMFVDFKNAENMTECINQAGINCELVIFESDGKYADFAEYLHSSPEEQNFVPYKVNNVKDTALILFSSGTTGYPKGTCHSHYSLIGQSLNKRTFHPGVAKSGQVQRVYLLFTHLYWSTAVISLIKSIIYGDAKVLCSKFNAVDTWKIIEKYKVTTMFVSVNVGLEFAANRPSDAKFESLTVFYTGGMRITEKFISELSNALPNIPVYQVYGQTETSGAITGWNVTDPKDFELQMKNPLSCGKILDHYEWKVVDNDTEKTLGLNEKGELRIKTEFLMNGYYKKDSSDVFDSEGYLKTGDIVYYNEDGCIFIVDRLKEMFKYGLITIVPSVIEDVLYLHPAIKEAAVIGIPHDDDEHHPMGVVTLKKGYNVTPEEIEKFVEKQVFESQRLLAGVKIINEMPKNSTGKIVRNVVKSKVLNGEL